MKKKMMALCLCAALLAVAAIGGTMAYFTDTDEATNTFTAGGVKIKLIEQQVNEEGTDLEDFSQEPVKVLMPIVGSVDDQKNQFGQPVAENYIDKIVTIKNSYKSDAWVRAYFAIPSVLDAGSENGFNPSMNVLHFDFGNEDGISTYNVQWLWNSEVAAANSGCNYLDTIIDGITYNVYYADYYEILPAGETTEQFISGVYLDKNVDMNEDGQYTITRDDGQTTVINDFDGSVKCPVYAVAVQAAGFDNAADAIKEAFGEDFNPWATK